MRVDKHNISEYFVINHVHKQFKFYEKQFNNEHNLLPENFACLIVIGTI